MKGRILAFLALVTLSGCATLRGTQRTFIGAGLGGGVGAVGGAVSSPNEESRGLNALVFGLGGALLGGGIALLTEPSGDPSDTPKNLRERERSLESSVREFQVMPMGDLPPFLRNRVQPLVIEESLESDLVSEDGTLHEPHRVYRIKRPGELFARPVLQEKGAQK